MDFICTYVKQIDVDVDKREKIRQRYILSALQMHVWFSVIIFLHMKWELMKSHKK